MEKKTIYITLISVIVIFGIIFFILFFPYAKGVREDAIRYNRYIEKYYKKVKINGNYYLIKKDTLNKDSTNQK